MASGQDKAERMHHTLILGIQVLLIRLCPLDDCLDMLLLFPSSFVVAPPMRPLVFAIEAQVSTSFAFRLAFVTLLASQTACKAALCMLVYENRKVILPDSPDLDLLCILEDFVEGESLVEGAAFFSFAEAMVKGVSRWEAVQYSCNATKQGQGAGIDDNNDRMKTENRAAAYYYEGMVAKTGQQCSQVYCGMAMR